MNRTTLNSFDSVAKYPCHSIHFKYRTLYPIPLNDSISYSCLKLLLLYHPIKSHPSKTHTKMSQNPAPDDTKPEETPENTLRWWYKKNAMRWKTNIRELDSVMRDCKDCFLDPDSEIDLESLLTQFVDVLQDVGQIAVKLRNFLVENKAAEVDNRDVEKEEAENGK